MNKIQVKIIALIIFLLFCVKSFATDCKTMQIGEARRSNFVNSDVVFFGTKIKDIGGGKSLFKIINLYKGLADSLATIKIKSQFAPRVGDNCLIYGLNRKGNEILINECSISRSFQSPINIIIHKYPIAPNPGKIASDSIRFNNDLANLKTNSRIELLEELFLLEKNKNNVNNCSCSSYEMYSYTFIVALMVLLITTTMLLLRKTKSK